MRAVREQPRLVTAKALWALCLVAAGIAIGVVIADDGGDAAQATQVRLSSAERSGRTQRGELQRTRVTLERAATERARAERALRDLRRANHRLQRQLKAAQRAVHRRKRRP
jgi:uncharacterized protein HemX